MLNHYCREKAISVTYSECLSVASFIHHTKGMRYIILPSQTLPAIQYFSTFSHKNQDFRKKSYWNKMYALIFSTNFIPNISYTEKDSAIYCRKCTFIGIRIKYPLFVPDFNNINLSLQIFEK